MYSVCLNCKEEFAPLEGNEMWEYCSWSCEEDYWERQEDNTDHYNYGRR